MRPSGFEPLTYRLEGGCSIQLSYGRLVRVEVKETAVGNSQIDSQTSHSELMRVYQDPNKSQRRDIPAS
jgi:hypothetical protein